MDKDLKVIYRAMLKTDYEPKIFDFLADLITREIHAQVNVPKIAADKYKVKKKLLHSLEHYKKKKQSILTAIMTKYNLIWNNPDATDDYDVLDQLFDIQHKRMVEIISAEKYLDLVPEGYEII